MNRAEFQYKKTVFTTLAVFLTAIVSVTFLSNEIAEFAKSGILLCLNIIIPSIFPFMILTDFVCSYVYFESFRAPKYIFEKLFKINGIGISAFIIGILCGFPIGAKISARLYKDGLITKDECERLICFTNNSGPAFIISGIGAGMLKSVHAGVVIYIIMIISAVAVGVLFGLGKSASSVIKKSEAHPSFRISEATASATSATICVCSYVILFSVICGIINMILGNGLHYLISVSFFEVSTAANQISSSVIMNFGVKAALISFAVSFSGISVHLQARALLSGSDISMKKYFAAKALQGIIAAMLSGIFYFFII